MATTTRETIQSRIRLRMRDVPNEAYGADPFSIELIMDEIANEFSERTKCYMPRFKNDITGTPSVPIERICIPNLFLITSVSILESDGTTRRVLRPMADDRIQRYYPHYIESPQAGAPDIYTYKPPYIYLYPRPDYTVNNAITIEGYGSPLSDWGDSSDVPPLPERCITAIVDGVCARRGEEYLELPGMAARVALWKDRFAEEMGRMEAQVIRQHDRERSQGFR